MTLALDLRTLASSTWYYNVTLFNGASLANVAAGAMTWARRDNDFAVGVDLSLDDRSIILPMDVVLPQPEMSCDTPLFSDNPSTESGSGGGGGPPGVGGGGRGGRGGDDPPAGDGGPPPPPPVFTVSDVHTDYSLTSGTASVSGTVSNYLGIGVRANLPLGAWCLVLALCSLLFAACSLLLALCCLLLAACSLLLAPCSLLKVNVSLTC